MVLLGKKIKHLRNKQKITQSELANSVGVTKSTIAAYENNSRTPSYEVLIKLAATLKTSLDFLLLDQQDISINIEGLTPEQIEITMNIITYFKKMNSEKPF